MELWLPAEQELERSVLLSREGKPLPTGKISIKICLSNSKRQQEGSVVDLSEIKPQTPRILKSAQLSLKKN